MPRALTLADLFFSLAAFFSSLDIFLTGESESGSQRFPWLLKGVDISSSQVLYLFVSSETTFGYFPLMSVVSLISFSRSNSSMRSFSATSFQFPERMAHFPFAPARTPIQVVMEFIDFAFERRQNAFAVQRFVRRHGEPRGVERRGK